MSAGQAWNNARRVLLVDVNNNALVTQPGNADDQPATDMGLVVNSRLHLFDGTNWDRAKAKANGWPGFALVRSSDGTELGMTNGATDGLSTGYYAAHANAQNLLYNGATWDRLRGNVEGTLLASAARTANALSPTQTNHNARGVVLFLNVTAASGTGGLTLRLWEYDPASAAPVITYQASSPIITTGLKRYAVYPGISGTDLGDNALARTWAVFVVAGDASSYTYSVGFCTIV